MVNILTLAVNDLRNIIRDRFLVFALFIYPIMLIVFSRILIHVIAPRVEDMFPLAANFIIVFMLFTLLLLILLSF